MLPDAALVAIAETEEGSEAPLTRREKWGQNYGRHTKCSSACVSTCSIPKHDGIRGVDTQLVQGQLEHLWIWLLHSVLEGQHEGVDTMIETCVPELWAKIEMDVAHHCDSCPAIPQA